MTLCKTFEYIPYFADISAYVVGKALLLACCTLSCPIAGQDEAGCASGSPSCLQVGTPVPDQERPAEIESERVPPHQEHAGPGFPARTIHDIRCPAFGGVVRTVVDSIDPGAFGLQQLYQTRVDGFEIPLRQESPGHTRLVRDDDDGHPHCVRLAHDAGR